MCLYPRLIDNRKYKVTKKTEYMVYKTRIRGQPNRRDTNKTASRRRIHNNQKT